MPLTGVIVILDDVPHVKVGLTLEDRPVVVQRYWPLPSARGYVTGGESARYVGDGYYSVATDGWGTRTFRLPGGGSTAAPKIEEEQVPAPRTRLLTRWYHGRWEKLSKVKGWVIA